MIYSTTNKWQTRKAKKRDELIYNWDDIGDDKNSKIRCNLMMNLTDMYI